MGPIYRPCPEEDANNVVNNLDESAIDGILEVIHEDRKTSIWVASIG